MRTKLCTLFSVLLMMFGFSLWADAKLPNSDVAIITCLNAVFPTEVSVALSEKIQVKTQPSAQKGIRRFMPSGDQRRKQRRTAWINANTEDDEIDVIITFFVNCVPGLRKFLDNGNLLLIYGTAFPIDAAVPLKVRLSKLNRENSFEITPAGEKFLPSLRGVARHNGAHGIDKNSVFRPWEVEVAFLEFRDIAELVVLRNVKTNGRVAVFFLDRAEFGLGFLELEAVRRLLEIKAAVISDFLLNWLPTRTGQAVQPREKLATMWAVIKDSK